MEFVLEYEFDCGDFDFKPGEVDISITRDLGEDYIDIEAARVYFEDNLMVDVTDWVKSHTHSAMYQDILDKADDKYKNIKYEKD